MTAAGRPVAVACLAASLVACSPGGPEQEVEFRVPVFVREVGTGTVEDRVVATGTLRSQESVALRADTAGALIVARDGSGRRLAEGDRVEAGQLIAEITGEEVRLTARTEATRERYETAKRDHESNRRLFEQGLLSEQEYQQLSATLAEAKIEWERSLLTESRSRLVTPIAGVILRLARDSSGLPLADGQLVSQAFEVAQVAPVGPLIADIDLVGSDLARVRVGLETRVRQHAFEDHSFTGRVIRLAPSIDPTTRTLRVEVEVRNREGLLRPGMFVEATMIADRREEVPVVPREAVAERGGRKVVFVVKGQRVNRREVALGLGDDEIVEIRQGLETGERIVVRGLETLTDGTRVRVSGA
jgi:membrane fusion protein (multidrug efflux system)